MIPPARTCTMCNGTYPSGTYRLHRQDHAKGLTRKGLTGTRTGHKRRDDFRAERNTAIALEVALGVRTLEVIGAAHGITRERVRQIAARECVSRDHRPVPALVRRGRWSPCRTCGESVGIGSMRSHRLAAGHPARANSKTTQTHLDLIREFYERGLGYHAIGTVLGLRFTGVKWHVLRMGLAPHRAGQYNRFGAVPALRRELAARLKTVAA